MKVEKINLPHLHNDEWYGFHSEFHEKGEKFGPEALGIMDLWIPYGGHLDKADKSLLLIPKSVYTEKMKAVDKERDAILGSINRLVKEAHNLPDVQSKEAAVRLSNLVSAYKLHALKGGYAAESALIYNLLQDLSKHTADIALLGLGEWVKALRQTEEKFLALHAQRIQEKTDKPQSPLVELRPPSDLYYHSMVNVFNAKLVADGLGGNLAPDPGDLDTGVWEDNDPTPPYLRGNIVYNFVVEWNVVVRYYHNIIAARTTRLAHKKEPDAPDPTDPASPEEPGTDANQ